MAITLTACTDDGDTDADADPAPLTTSEITSAPTGDSAAADAEADEAGPNPTLEGREPAGDADDQSDQGENEASTTASEVPITTVGHLGVSDYIVFTTPSRNIKCSIMMPEQDELRCDIEESDTGVRSVLFSTTERIPRINRTGDAGAFRELERQGVSAQVIDYGTAGATENFLCESEYEGLTCRVKGTTSAFIISREGTGTTRVS
ncbi:hypothetical protein ACT3SZ_07110 [Corynebacterium sp. AOP40-9SA-29]|uniref:hypothetical protein n=1 Tax=Corynebacterium sp. AOP40-9SA-29 TaxID=3457677 RepID=UPI00403319E5